MVVRCERTIVIKVIVFNVDADFAGCIIIADAKTIETATNCRNPHGRDEDLCRLGLWQKHRDE